MITLVIKKVFNAIRWVLILVSGLLLIGIMSCVVLAVLDRVIFRHGFFWTEELARILFIWFSMVAPTIMAINETQFKVTFFFDRLFKGRGRLVASSIIHLMMIIILSQYMIYGIGLASLVSVQLLPSIRVGNMAFMHSALPIGMGLLVFVNSLLLVVKVIRLITNRISDETEAEKGEGVVQDGF